MKEKAETQNPEIAETLEMATKTVGVQPPPSYWTGWPWGDVEVLGQPAPFARDNKDKDPHHINPVWLQPWPMMNRTKEEQRYLAFVDTDGHVLYVDMNPAIGVMARTRKPVDERRFKDIIASGRFNAQVKDAPTPKQKPGADAVPCPGGAYAVTPDNSDLFADLPRGDDGTVLLHPEDSADAHSGPAYAYAEEAIRRYRAQKPAKAWHKLIGPYPVVDWYDDLALMATNKHAWELEVEIGHILEDLSGKAAELRLVRSFVLACIEQEKDPIEETARFGRAIIEPSGYLAKLTHDLGGHVPSGPSSPPPVVTRVSPLGLGRPAGEAEVAKEAEGSYPLDSAPSSTSKYARYRTDS